MNMLNLPKKVYFKNGCANVALRELSEVYHMKRALLVSNPRLYRNGIVSSIGRQLRKQGIRTAEFFSIGAVPSFADLRSGLPKLSEFEPDVIVGIGGGGAMSAAKALWLLYENPEMDLAAAVESPARIRTGVKAKQVLVATSFGSGAQNSPFCALKNDSGDICVINSFALLPELSVTDARFTESLSPTQIKACGLSTLSQSIRAFAGDGCCEYTQGLLGEAVRAVLKNLKAAENGCPVALEKLHNAAALAGAAYGNAMDTIDFTAPFYSFSTEKAMHQERIELLAHDLNLSGTQKLWEACEALF
ncbi:iron-containing alcohol dehydrogenase [uncultured Oscillibacter sp.]|uniref:iron-containing alcohol dehydrogenase n=1 Tax=uncultured Oscillibacter sp. TaxID=876091 RepID=UPI0025FBD62F|nr:iron-containing alcohol dehydrogenase [uncultured Oscillibacter sp.]